MRVRSRLVAGAALTAAVVAGLGLAGPPASAGPVRPAANSACPWVGSTAPVADRVSQVLAKMSVAQEISLVHGSGGSSYVGFTPAIPALCVPALNLQDGPAGVGDGLTNVTQLPAPVAAAATWDPTAEAQYGNVIGAEQAGKGTNIDLGPTINMVRDPRWGRAFESLGEDPYLAGQLGAAEIRGIQGTGTMAQVKHLAVYNQETNRNTPSDNAIIDNRTMQEIYLPAFGAAVGQGAASSVMCSYSTINGTYACQNPYLENTVLRQQFGFTGFVTSDWGATHSTVASANAGLDQEMPGGDYYGSALQTDVQNGSVPKSTLDSMVSGILTEMFDFGLFDKAPTGSPGAPVTTAAHVSTARQVAEEGTVLLKNSGNVLPVNTSSVHSIAVIGADASTSVVSAGGGSAGVSASGLVTPLQGIQSRAGSGVSVAYNDGSSTSSAATAAKNANLAVVFVDTTESEGSDLSSIDLPGSQDSLISAVAAANPNTVVVVNSGSAVVMPWLSQVAGVMESWYPGQEDGNAIAALLFGDVDPSGHLPVSFPQSLSDVPAHTTAQWPGTNGQVQYSEGVDIGYRWYDSQNKTPLFPFGFGLSYTSFGYSNLQISGLNTAGGKATVTATVTNTGTREGADVAQLYVGDPASAGEPVRQLKGFQRVDLQPGASTTVSFPLTAQDLAYYNNSGGWTTATGNYAISVGDSSRTLPLTGTLAVTAAQVAANPVKVTNPTGQTGIVGTAVNLTVHGTDATSGQSLHYTATGLPAGLSISSAGVISGTPTAAGTATVTVTGTDGLGATANSTFVFTVEPTGSGQPTGQIAGYAGLCVDLASDDNTNGSHVQTYTCNGTDGQEWTVEPDGSLHAEGKCMDVTSAGTANGTPVQIYDCNGTGAQQWKAQSDGSLINPASGRCLDVTGQSTSPGTQLQIWDCTGGANQKWTLP